MGIGEDWLGSVALYKSLKARGSLREMAGRLEASLAAMSNLEVKHSELLEAYASCAAAYQAYRLALAKADPSHPVVVDVDLRERLHNAAVAAVHVAGESVDAMDVGKTFAIPAREGGEPLSIPQYQALVGELNRSLDESLLAKLELQAQLDALKSEAKKIEVDLIDHVAQRAALRKELSRVQPENPLVTNADLRQRISDAGQRAFAIDGSWSAVNEAGASFLLPTAKSVGGRLPEPDPTFVAGLTEDELAGRSGEDGV